jgi:hypothetical protein
LGSLKCNWDLNHALDISAKEKEKEMSTRFIKCIITILDKII